MEPLTHGLSGAIIGRTLPHQTLAWWFPLWAAFTAMSPDLDVFFIHTPLEYIKYHRGITHSLAGGWALAFACALLLVPLSRWRKRRRKLGDPLPPEPWSLIGAWCMAYLLILHHLWLDCMNSYGTQLFLPFNDYRVRLNALFIVDPLLTLPLFIGLIWKYSSRGAMACLLLWTLLYPMGSLGTRLFLEDHLANALQAELQEPGTGNDGTIHPQSGLYLVPDAFTPFRWKLILSRGDSWDVAGYSLGQGAPTNFTSYAKPPLKIWRKLADEDLTFRNYERFAAFPVVEEVRQMAGGGVEYVFFDLRFGSTIGWVDAIQSVQDDKPLTFRIMARFAPDGSLTAVRLVTTPGAGGDSGWQPPDPD